MGRLIRIKNENAHRRGCGRHAILMGWLGIWLLSGNATAGNSHHNRWVAEGVTHSDRGNVVLIVDKALHQMRLLRAGQAVHTYNVELGMETEAEGGWRPTPVGVFDLKYKSYTKYYKALLFRMPGYFEIHGSGTGLGKRGQDWTWGCIALSDRDMDDLFERIGIEENGIPVSSRRRARALKNARLIIIPEGLDTML